MRLLPFISSQINRLVFKEEPVIGVQIESLEEPVPVYNIEVSDTHNYFSSFLNHNCDDLLTEQDSLSGNPDLYENIWTWVLSGPMQRLQPGGRLIHIATRWSKLDPIGKVQRRMKDDPYAEQYESIVIPALDKNDESTFPEIWSTKALHAKRNLLMPHMWNAQYMQNPTVASGAIISRDKWQVWDKCKPIPGTNEVIYTPPQCKLILMVMDTAYTNNKRSDPTAVTVWGCFNHLDPLSGEEQGCLILLWCDKKKMEFPELKRQAKEWIKEWEADVVLIEAKSSGPMLISELNQAGIPAIGVTPKPLEDKVSRLNSVTSVFASKRVFYMPTHSNEALIEEVNDFPQGDEDHYSDCTAYAVRWFRQSGMVVPADDASWAKGDNEGPTTHGSYY